MTKEKIDKYSKLLYLIVFTFFIGFSIYICVSFSNVSYAKYEKNTDILQLDWTYTAYGNSAVMTTIVSNLIPYDYCIGFNTGHTNVTVYADNDLIYSFTEGDNAFGNTPGHGYHLIHQIYLYYGKNISIHLNSPYGVTIPKINLATEKTLMFYELSKCLLPISLGIITFVVGVFFLAYGVYSIRKRKLSSAFIFLGFFTMTLGLYTCNEQNFFKLMINNHIVSAYLSFILLMLLPIPFILFEKDLYTNKHHFGWYISIALNFINVIASTTLQIFDIISYKELLPVTHIMFATSLGIIVLITIQELILYKLTKSLQLNIFCISTVIIFVSIDMIYYYNGKIAYFTNMGFLLYIIVIGLYFIKANTTLIEKGKKAEQYLTLAYQDNLTGIGNRTAHASFLEEADVASHSYIIGMFDLNNLKYYNDTFGHELGDTYIKSSASFIKEAFSKIAGNNCYRIGGDEFCVILEDKTEEQFISCNNHLQMLIDDYNSTSDNLKIHIAAGYAIYDASIDHDLKETRSRADAMMYNNKFTMKQKLNQI